MIITKNTPRIPKIIQDSLQENFGIFEVISLSNCGWILGGQKLRKKRLYVLRRNPVKTLWRSPRVRTGEISGSKRGFVFGKIFTVISLEINNVKVFKSFFKSKFWRNSAWGIFEIAEISVE